MSQSLSVICMKKIVIKNLLFISLLSAGDLLANTRPFLNTDREINFGSVLFVPGNCTMSHVDGSFSNINPAVMCGTGGNGSPGRYVIFADPNRQVSVKLLQRDNSGDGLMFIPEGQLISDTETHAITAGVAQEIDSGVSGIVNIHVGGRLFVLTSISPSSSFEFTLEDGIEWSVLP
jgi:hypothetical protein